MEEIQTQMKWTKVCQAGLAEAEQRLFPHIDKLLLPLGMCVHKQIQDLNQINPETSQTAAIAEAVEIRVVKCQTRSRPRPISEGSLHLNLM